MTNSPETDPLDNVAWWTFENQTIIGHALVALIGIGVWFGVYAYWLEAVAGSFQFATIGTPEAIEARLDARRAASTACWLWFSLAVLVGKGGPFLNTVIYPLVLLMTGPWITAFVAFGSWPQGGPTTATRWSPAFIADGFSLFLPGFLLMMVVVGGFALLLYLTGRSEAWTDKHMPEEYHQIEVDD